MIHRIAALAIVLLLAPFLTPAQDGPPTYNAGRWLAKSGSKNPYRGGPISVIEVGAYADMILVEGNPLEDVAVLADYDKNIKVVIKDGDIFKNAL